MEQLNSLQYPINPLKAPKDLLKSENIPENRILSRFLYREEILKSNPIHFVPKKSRKPEELPFESIFQQVLETKFFFKYASFHPSHFLNGSKNVICIFE
ncbi:hypothetical protein LBK6_14020 [Leptospira borgpetersenii serovar Hardjo]|nr:hypothetical protein LBK6_14020 [Leptospira borgpetersenii serovar Hardjo]AMX62626.1 hypothetical protein LBK9_13940 [Leptospira borgpetersenii serovar Hardjo]AMX65869.1 hypothetical protein LBK30_13950 [Leptospira borgpetersenii serovar Hardjo]AMX69102.1 hypothetical protein LBHA_13905 [Leptospira borgpetersenii serovar Hardjo]